MGFFDYLDNLRSRPIEERRKLALYATIGITVIIILFWLANLAIISSIENPNRETRIGREIKKIKLGGQVVKDAFKSVLGISQSKEKNIFFEEE